VIIVHENRGPEKGYSGAVTDGGERGGTRVSVVIPNWNGGEMLTEVLRGLEAQEFDSFEAIVVDDGSTDGSLEHARQKCRPFRAVELERNVGFAAACNAGAEAARGELRAHRSSRTGAKGYARASIGSAPERAGLTMAEPS